MAAEWVASIRAQCIDLRRTQYELLRKSGELTGEEGMPPPPKEIMLTGDKEKERDSFTLPLKWKQARDMPLGVAMTRRKKLVRYIEISDDRKGSWAQSSGQWFVARSDCALVWESSTSGDADTTVATLAGKDRALDIFRGPFEEAVADYWRVMADAQIALTAGLGITKTPHSLVDPWLQLPIFSDSMLRRSAYYFILSTTASHWSPSARHHWAILEAHVERMTAGTRLGRDLVAGAESASVTERTVPLVYYWAAVALLGRKSRAASSSWMSVDHLSWQAGSQVATCSTEAYARVFLPWKRAQAVADDFVKAAAVPNDMVRDMFSRGYDWLCAQTEPSPNFRIHEIVSRAVHARSDSEDKKAIKERLLGLLRENLRLEEQGDAQTRELIKLAGGSQAGDIEDLMTVNQEMVDDCLPDCLRGVIKEGRAKEHLKHEDRYRIAAQFHVLGAEHADALFSYFAGRTPLSGKNEKDQEMLADMGHVLKQKRGRYLASCAQIAGLKLPSGNVLKCKYGGRRDLCDPAEHASFSSPAGYVAIHLGRRRRKKVEAQPPVPTKGQ